MLGEPVVEDEVVKERRREVERGDALAPRSAAAPRACPPPRLGHVAPAEEVHREQGVDPHRVVERHHAERPLDSARSRVAAPGRGLAGAVGTVRPRYAFRACPSCRTCTASATLSRSSRSSAPGCCGPSGSPCASRITTTASAVADAVVDLFLRQPPGQRYDDGSRPLRRPVEERRLDTVVEDHGHVVAFLGAEPAGDPGDPGEQLAVPDARGNASSPGCRSQAARSDCARFTRCGPPIACDNVSQASSIASTIGA